MPIFSKVRRRRAINKQTSSSSLGKHSVRSSNNTLNGLNNTFDGENIQEKRESTTNHPYEYTSNGVHGNVYNQRKNQSSGFRIFGREAPKKNVEFHGLEPDITGFEDVLDVQQRSSFDSCLSCGNPLSMFMKQAKNGSETRRKSVGETIAQLDSVFNQKFMEFEAQEAALRALLWKTLAFSQASEYALKIGVELSIQMGSFFDPSHTARSHAEAYVGHQSGLLSFFRSSVTPSLRKSVCEPLRQRLLEMRMVRTALNRRNELRDEVFRRRRKVTALATVKSAKEENNRRKLGASQMRFSQLHDEMMESLELMAVQSGNFIEPLLQTMMRLSASYFSAAFRTSSVFDASNCAAVQLLENRRSVRESTANSNAQVSDMRRKSERERQPMKDESKSLFESSLEESNFYFEADTISAPPPAQKPPQQQITLNASPDSVSKANGVVAPVQLVGQVGNEVEVWDDFEDLDGLDQDLAFDPLSAKSVPNENPGESWDAAVNLTTAEHSKEIQEKLMNEQDSGIIQTMPLDTRMLVAQVAPVEELHQDFDQIEWGSADLDFEDESPLDQNHVSIQQNPTTGTETNIDPSPEDASVEDRGQKVRPENSHWAAPASILSSFGWRTQDTAGIKEPQSHSVARADPISTQHFDTLHTIKSYPPVIPPKPQKERTVRFAN